MANKKKKQGNCSVEAKKRILKSLNSQISLEKRKQADARRSAELDRKIEKAKKTLASLRTTKKK